MVLLHFASLRNIQPNTHIYTPQGSQNEIVKYSKYWLDTTPDKQNIQLCQAFDYGDTYMHACPSTLKPLDSVSLLHHRWYIPHSSLHCI